MTISGAGAEQRVRAATLVLAVLTVTLIVGCGLAAIFYGVRFTGDNAIISIRSHDVGTNEQPLLGTRSSVSTSAEAVTHHPGPVAFVLLAPFVRLMGPAGAALGAAIINAAWVGAAIWLTRRRWGWDGAASLSGALLVLVASMGTAEVSSPWGPSMLVMPFAAMLVSLASIAKGDRRAGWWTFTLAVTLLAQTHLALVPLCIVAAVCAASFELSGIRSGARGVPSTRMVAPLALVLTVLWSPVFVEQFTDAHPNISLIASGGGGVRAGLSRAVRMVAVTVGTPFGWTGARWEHPWFLNTAQPGDEGRNAPVAVVVLSLLVLGFVVAFWLRRRRTRAAGAFLAVGFVVSVAVCALAPFERSYLSLGWFRWLWAGAAVLWAAVATTLLRSRRWPRGAIQAVLGCAVIAALVVGVLRVGEDTRFWSSDRALMAQTSRPAVWDAVPQGSVTVRWDIWSAGAGSGLMWDLLRHQREPVPGALLGAASPVDPTAEARRIWVLSPFGDERRNRPRREDPQIWLQWYAQGYTPLIPSSGRIVSAGPLEPSQATELLALRAKGADTPRRHRLEERVATGAGAPIVVVVVAPTG